MAKRYAYGITVNDREAYGFYACNGILFNHESSLRGETFVTRKITRALARIALGLQDCLYLGNLDARRDWGHARDYVEMQWLMLQQEQTEDFVIATGKQRRVRDFVTIAAGELGIGLCWEGQGVDEIGLIESILAPNLCNPVNSSDHTAPGIHSRLKPGDIVVRVDPRYFRPTEVETLLGNPGEAKLGLRSEVKGGQSDLSQFALTPLVE